MSRIRQFIVLACLVLLQGQVVLASSSPCQKHGSEDSSTMPAMNPAQDTADEHFFMAAMDAMEEPGVTMVADTPCHGNGPLLESTSPASTADSPCIQCALGCGGFASLVAPAAACAASGIARASTPPTADESVLSGSLFPALRPPIL